MPDSRANIWLQRLSLATMVVFAVALLGVGASLVGRSPAPSHFTPPTQVGGK